MFRQASFAFSFAGHYKYDIIYIMENEAEKYSDIINLPRHEPDPEKHSRMDVYNRAAQFAPFAALTGFEDSIESANPKAVN